jgi:hypothetical protein
VLESVDVTDGDSVVTTIYRCDEATLIGGNTPVVARGLIACVDRDTACKQGACLRWSAVVRQYPRVERSRGNLDEVSAAYGL